MNKKGFTLIELIAVVVIMAIIALIATPNIVNMMDKGKKSDYVAYANNLVSKATYMYKQEKYKNKFDSKRIYLKNIKDIEDFVDPYGFTYNKDKSYVEFYEQGSTLKEREVRLSLVSVDKEEISCYMLEASKKSEIDSEHVKNGTYDGTNCHIN